MKFPGETTERGSATRVRVFPRRPRDSDCRPISPEFPPRFRDLIGVVLGTLCSASRRSLGTVPVICDIEKARRLVREFLSQISMRKSLACKDLRLVARGAARL